MKLMKSFRMNKCPILFFNSFNRSYRSNQKSWSKTHK